MKFDISVILISSDRVHLLKRCVDSLLTSARQHQSLRFELLLGINEKPVENSEAESFAESLMANQSEAENVLIRVFTLSGLLPSKARNEVLSEALGEWFYFIDDDAFIEQDFFSRFLEVKKAYPEADVIGGPNLTPKTSSDFQKISGAVLSSQFGSALSSVRYRKAGVTRTCGDESLILCNLFVRRSVLCKKPFPERFVCNEENLMLQDLKLNNRRLIYDPELYVSHERRQKLLSFASQIYKYGTGRGQNIRSKISTLRWFHIAPSLLLFYIFFLIIYSFVNPSFSKTYWIPLLAYMLLSWVAAFALVYRREIKVRFAPIAVVFFALIHIPYGLGVFRGLLKKHK